MLACVLTISGCAMDPDPVSPAARPAPRVERGNEQRGVWVATVANIDWPSAKGLSDAQRRAEMIRILDVAKDVGLNTIYFQVRPCGDALYKSALEPWSEFLTGSSGVGPSDGSDPLAEWVTEAHARGLQLHAWINPFRVGHPKMVGKLAASHPANALAAVTRSYGEYKWLDPGEERAREHSLRVVEDLARRYDIDGFQIDDYFYPYPVKDAKGATVDFPDNAAWNRYLASGGKLSRGDWRRENITSFLIAMNRRAKAIKPSLVMGVSPFGIWKPDFPAGVKGFDAYEGLYADARSWLSNGTVDYLAPQLYWKIDAPQQPFQPLLNWWVAQNTHGKRVYAGLNLSKVGPNAVKDFAPSEITRQIDLIRATPGADGFVLFSMRPLLENKLNVRELLKAKIAERPATRGRRP